MAVRIIFQDGEMHEGFIRREKDGRITTNHHFETVEVEPLPWLRTNGELSKTPRGYQEKPKDQ